MNTLTLADRLKAIDLALYVPEYQTLAIADVHVGFEEALHQEGTLVPRGHVRQLVVRLERILRSLGMRAPLARVVINGDLGHHFGPLSTREWEESRKFLETLLTYSRRVDIIEGNHDSNVQALIAGIRGVQIHRSLELGDLLFLHGDRVPDLIPVCVRTLVMGHEHPAVGLRDSVTGRVELYKCYLVGRYRDRGLVVQPSFNPWTQGSDLTQERCLSPLLSEEALGEFEVYPVSDEGHLYRFGPLGSRLGS
jgi:putative SbcD/Mre11-related phosphoesterase